jgi:hypothetical protein
MILPQRLTASATAVRVFPFVLFIVLTACQDLFGSGPAYWFYFVKTLVVGWLLWTLRPHIPEMRWTVSLEAVAVGLLVFIIWVGLDPFLMWLGFDHSYPKLFASRAQPWNPHHEFGHGSFLAWFFIAVRAIGSSAVVPPLEEVFFRSWLYRYIARPDFQSVPLGRFLWTPFVVTVVLFGLEHREWLAGILAGCAYTGLVCWKKRLGDAITAHAITNALLALWIIRRAAWHFW